jgi:crotonobetainyl-CoA:carnitine CoA-transferase CaiB-like acyl-CoA transferase
MTLLAGFRALEIGPGRAAAVAGRAFTDLGAEVETLSAETGSPLLRHLNDGKTVAVATMKEAIRHADLVICEGGPDDLETRGLSPATLRALNAKATLVLISPFGQTGPLANAPATDLTLFCASGIARVLTGQVDDLSEAPVRPVGAQSAFIGGLAGAAAGMHAALLSKGGGVIDVSIQEALATLSMTELTRAGRGGSGWVRKRKTDGNGATVCILPASDGYAAISPREDHQWSAWLEVMGRPDWGDEPRFKTKPDRVANWDDLHRLMSEWSHGHNKQWIADAAQAAHVPSFPLREPLEQLDSIQLAHRAFFREPDLNDDRVKVPDNAYGISLGETSPDNESAGNDGPLPLSGVRVLDFSWVIAGPTTTRYLAAMGADVIKIEAPGRGDPGRTSELHTALGQAKRGIVLNLKDPAAVDIARDLAAKSDILIENFATGVMDRLGLGADSLREVNPRLLYISASGQGRTGPEARGVAYGTLLQCYAGFAGLNGHPGRPPRVGMAWLDPMCGLKLALAAAAALWHRRRTGAAARIDFSMVEAMLWTMAAPLLDAQLGPPPTARGNLSDTHAPHGIYRCAGEDAWVGLAVRSKADWRILVGLVPELTDWKSLDVVERQARATEIDARLTDWTLSRTAEDAAAVLGDAGLPAAVLATTRDLARASHLAARGFWEASEDGPLPGLPWQASFGRKSGPAPGLGADTDAVLREVLGLADAEIARLRESGALG